MAFHDALHEIPDAHDDFRILTHVQEREILSIEALHELTVADDANTIEARAVLTDRRQMSDRTHAAREQAEAQALVARDRLQALVEARLMGEPDPAEAEARRHAVEVSIEIDTLTTLEAKVGGELKEAEAALAQAVHTHKLAVARERWDTLADEQRQLCMRLTKSLREVRAWWEKLRDGASAMEDLSAVLGNPLSWHQSERRILQTHLKASLYGVVGDIEYISGGKRDLANMKLCDLWPFAKSLATPEAPAEDTADA